jgi:hypothetical protein
MSDKSGFLDIVAEFDQFQDDVDLSYRPSEIGVGEYTVLLTKFAMDKVIVQDVENAVAKATFQIFVGEREGDTFTDTFWFPRGATGASMAQRGFLLLARCISGRTIPSVSEAVETLEGAVGNATLMLSIDPSTSKKTGKKYFNVNYKSTVDAT